MDGPAGGLLVQVDRQRVELAGEAGDRLLGHLPAAEGASVAHQEVFEVEL